jgi:hypothetical protein
MFKRPGVVLFTRKEGKHEERKGEGGRHVGINPPPQRVLKNKNIDALYGKTNFSALNIVKLCYITNHTPHARLYAGEMPCDDDDDDKKKKKRTLLSHHSAIPCHLHAPAI